MDIILLERVDKLGQMGDVVSVKPGYARNYLLPKGKAKRATKANREAFETMRAQLEAHNLERRQEAEDIAGRMAGLQVVLIRQAGDSGQLYGSVNARDIADQVTAAGFSVTRNQVTLDKPIKTLGMHPVTVRLHPEVTVTVTANVARTPDEAEAQAAGRDPLRSPLDDDDDEDLYDEADALFDGDEAAEGAAAEAEATDAGRGDQPVIDGTGEQPVV